MKVSNLTVRLLGVVGLVCAGVFLSVEPLQAAETESANSDLAFVAWPNWGADSWKQSWSVAVADALDKPASSALLDNSVWVGDSLLKEVCPDYNDLNRTQRKIFWAHMFASMALHESSFDPYCIAENDGGGNDSIGLLQLSYEDGEWARAWGFEASHGSSALSLTNPEVNVRSGVAIMAAQVTQDKKIFVDYDERIYWAVLAPSFIAERPSYNVIKTFNTYRDENLDFCD